MKKRTKKKIARPNPKITDKDWGKEIPKKVPLLGGERRRPRSQARFENYMELEEKTGYSWGDGGPVVLVSEVNPDLGVWGLDKSGREVAWLSNPKNTGRRRKK